MKGFVRAFLLLLGVLLLFARVDAVTDSVAEDDNLDSLLLEREIKLLMEENKRLQQTIIRLEREEEARSTNATTLEPVSIRPLTPLLPFTTPETPEAPPTTEPPCKGKLCPALDEFNLSFPSDLYLFNATRNSTKKALTALREVRMTTTKYARKLKVLAALVEEVDLAAQGTKMASKTGAVAIAIGEAETLLGQVQTAIGEGVETALGQLDNAMGEFDTQLGIVKTQLQLALGQKVVSPE